MATKLDDLLAEALRLSPQDRERLLAILKAAQIAEADAVRDGGTTYQGDFMTLVTVTLPDDLAEQAGNAGLLAGKSLEEMIRRALQEYNLPASTALPPHRERRLVRENGYLVVESFPGEKPITAEEVRQILDDMEG